MANEAGPPPGSRQGSLVSGWLGGPGALPDGTTAVRPSLLGLPPEGPGSAAGPGRKALGLFIDWIVAVLVTRAIFLPAHHANQDLENVLQLVVFGFEVTLLQCLTGQSIGQRFTGTRLAPVGTPRLRPLWVLARTVLIIIPPLILGCFTDADRRGLHDRAAGTVVLML